MLRGPFKQAAQAVAGGGAGGGGSGGGGGGGGGGDGGGGGGGDGGGGGGGSRQCWQRLQWRNSSIGSVGTAAVINKYFELRLLNLYQSLRNQ
jgi:hypothetical protein